MPQLKVEGALTARVSFRHGGEEKKKGKGRRKRNVNTVLLIIDCLVRSRMMMIATDIEENEQVTVLISTTSKF